MSTTLILSFSGDGRYRASLLGKGKARQKISKAFSKHIKDKLPEMKQKIRNALGVIDEDTNPYFH